MEWGPFAAHGREVPFKHCREPHATVGCWPLLESGSTICIPNFFVPAMVTLTHWQVILPH